MAVPLGGVDARDRGWRRAGTVEGSVVDAERHGPRRRRLPAHAVRMRGSRGLCDLPACVQELEDAVVDGAVAQDMHVLPVAHPDLPRLRNGAEWRGVCLHFVCTPQPECADIFGSRKTS